MAELGLSLENVVFANFSFYAAVVLLKTVLMSVWTAKYRLTRKVFISPEDYVRTGAKVPVNADPDIERVRRCHLNDLENVLPFVLIGLLYVLTGPEVATATLVFRIFTVARLIHTFVYLLVVPQPARALAFYAGFFVNSYMAIAVLRKASF